MADMRASALLLLALASGASAANADDPPVRLAEVLRAESVGRVSGARNVYPWHRDVPGKDGEYDTIFISNACGFAKVRYRMVVSATASRPWVAYALLGEWCGKEEFAAKAPTLVAFSDWEGKSYILCVAEILTDENGRRYVDDSLFIEDAGLEFVTGPNGEERVYLDGLKIDRDVKQSSSR